MFLLFFFCEGEDVIGHEVGPGGREGVKKREVRNNGLVKFFRRGCHPAVPAWAVMPMRRYLPAKTRAFLAHLEQLMERG